MRELTFDDLATVGYVPHTTRNEEGPLGNMVLMNDAGEDIGALLLSGEYKGADTFTQIFADVLARVSSSGIQSEEAVSEES